MAIKSFILLPLTGMLIGYLTNWVALRLLFRPRKKILGIQGLIPKRKEKLAEKISSVSQHFFPRKVDSITKIPYLGEKVNNHIKEEIKQKIKQVSDKDLEKMIKNIAKHEFKFIEISGAFLGLVIGLIQALILQL